MVYRLFLLLPGTTPPYAVSLSNLLEPAVDNRVEDGDEHSQPQPDDRDDDPSGEELSYSQLICPIMKQ